jgi:hypothetical protein
VPSGNPSRDARLGTISGTPEPAASSGGRSIQNCPIRAQQHIPADPVSSTPNRQGDLKSFDLITICRLSRYAAEGSNRVGGRRSDRGR